jgi:iron complex outermembrane receptor protein
MSSKAFYRASGAIIAFSAAHSPVYAFQTAPSEETMPASEPDATDESGGVDEIIVTANRRAQNQQEVPISIVAFEGETLKVLGVQSTVDLPQITPGLSITRTLVGASAFLRGVGTNTAGYSTEVPIATYVDGLYLPNSAAAAFSFNNIERIEVLKGPQGTLYGRNTTGGLIHVITRDPDRDTSIDASVSYSSYDTVQANFYGSTPISDTLAANVALVYIDQGEGWGRNLFTGSDVFKINDFGVQGKLQWTPTDATKITLRGFYDKTTTDQGNAAYIYPGSVGSEGSVFLGEYNINARIDPRANQRQYMVSLKAEQDLGFATLSSISGYINNRSDSLQVQTGNLGQVAPGRAPVFLGGRPQKARTYSQELNLASNGSAPFQWILGAFYYNDKTTISADVFGLCSGTGTGNALPCAGAPPLNTTGIQRTKSYSAYGEGTYSITPTTRITLGLRYTRDKKTLGGIVTPLTGFPNSLPALPPGFVSRPGLPFAGFPNGIDTSLTFPKITWKAVLAQDLSDDIHAFVSYNRGFKSGGFNPTSFTNPASRPEVLDAFEAGIKSELFDRTLRLNGSVFYYDYKDIQLRTTAPPAPPGGTLLINAASAKIKGIDLDFIFEPVNGLSFNGGVNVLDARYKKFPGGTRTIPNTVDGVRTGGFTSQLNVPLDGFRLPSSPKFSFVLGVTYTFDTSVGEFVLNANDGYKSDYFWEPDNRLKQESFHLVNASVTWNATDRTSLQLFGRNLAGEYYFSSAAEGTGGNDVHLPAAPRTYGIKARHSF